MPGLVKPHGGGSLKPLMLAGEALAAERAHAASLPKLRVSSREKGDLIMLGIGGFTPLAGFMTRADWEGVCDAYRTASGLFWPIPITLSADEVVADGIKTGAEIALMDPDGDEALATMRVSAEAQSSVLFYLLAYTASTAGAFGTLILCGSRGKEAVSYEDLAGLGRRHPAAALAFSLFLLSLAGVPPTAGFFGKLYVFQAAIDAELYALAVIGLLNSVIGA